jgi:tetratricopeptide (TPR) repeat protein
MEDFYTMGSPSRRRSSGDNEDNEEALLIMLTMGLVKHDKETQADIQPTVAAFKPVLPHFWLTMALATAALAEQDAPGSEERRSTFDQARSFMHKALRREYHDSRFLHTAGKMLLEFGQEELQSGIEGDSGVTGKDVEKIFEEACDYLKHAAFLAPTQADILDDLGQALVYRSSCVQEQSERMSLLQEATRRFDAARDCFNETNCRYKDISHPFYTRALLGGALSCWSASSQTDDPAEEQELLEEAYRRLHAALAADEKVNLEGSLLAGQIVLELAWRPGRPDDRRAFFAEACERYTAIVAEHPNDHMATGSLASALIGRAALASGDEARGLLARAEELFVKMSGTSPQSSEPYQDACRAWLRLAAEPSASAETAMEGALQAAAAARKANSIEPGSADYNLACALSRLGQWTEAGESLYAVLAQDSEAISRALKDPDLQPLWEVKPDLREAIADEKEPYQRRLDRFSTAIHGSSLE